MPAEKETTEAKLRRQIAETEAKIDTLKIRLAKAVARKTGEKVPATGLDLLWNEALPIARNRSSKQQCRVEWNKIHLSLRPPVQEVITALKAWNRCPEWKKDGNAFVPALHRWIKNLGWEYVPESTPAPSRYRTAAPKQPAPQADAAEILTNREELARFFSLKSKDQ